MLEPTYSVTELNATVRELLESDERLQSVWVTGEVTDMKRHSSGHWYFGLKDKDCQLKCVMWRSSAERQSFLPKNGDALMAHGYIGVYETRGEYQLYADKVRPAGIGDLYQQFEELKARLDAEGLFAPERKRPIPSQPRQIGVVTSAEAAAFQDIQNVLRRRFPLAEIILSATAVQGSDAPPQIVKAIERLNQYTQVDVILVIRGGGSLEDLWAFNDERVAYAIATSRIPVISGVGHEIDFTIADFVADLRAPTPSAAAEVATPNVADLRAEVERLDDTLHGLMDSILATKSGDLSIAQRTMGRLSPAGFICTSRQRIDDLNARLVSLERGRLTLLGERLAARDAALKAANPQAILGRGYALVYRSEDGGRVTKEKDATPGTGISIQLGKGELKARVEDKDSHGRYKRTLF